MAEDNKVVIEFVGDTSKLQQSLQDVNQQVLNTGKVSQQAFGEFNKANQQAEQSTQKLAGNLNDLNRTVANGAMREYSKDIQTAVGQLYDQGKVTEALITKYGNATSALKAMQKELATMATLGQRGTKEFKELARATAELQDTIQDTRGEIKKMASDTKIFDTLVQGARGMAAAFSVATGLSAALGDENKDLQQTLLKVQGAMAALQGVQELANLATEKGGIVTQTYGLVLKGVTAVQNTFAISAAAAWAVATAGISLLVTAIVGALAYFDAFTEKQEKATEATSELNKELNNQRDNLRKLSDENKERTGQISTYEKERNEIIRAYAKKAVEIQIKYGKDASELLKNNEQEKNLALANLHQKYLEDLANQEAEANNKEKKRNEQKLKEYYQHLREMQKADEDAILQRLKAYDEASKKLDEELVKAGDNTSLSKEQRIQYYYLAGMSKEEIAERLAKVLSEAEQQTADVLNSRIKGASFGRDYFAEVWKGQKEKQAKSDLEIEKEVSRATIELAKFTTDAIFSYESERTQQELNDRLKAIEKQKQQELENINLTEGQKAAIEEKYRRQEAAAKAKAWKAEQTSKAEQAIMNGLLALTTSLAQQGYPAGLVTGLLAVAQAGVQAGLILSKPIPAFEKGTEYVALGNNPKGTDTIPAYLNEGERVVPTHINQQLKGIKNEDLPKLMAAYYPPMPHAPELSKAGIVALAPVIDYKQLGKAVANELRANPQTHLHIDKNGFAVHLIEKGRRVEKINNRYES